MVEYTPHVGISTVIARVSRFRAALGDRRAAKDEAAKALGFTAYNGAAAGCLSSCVGHGLLDSRDGTYGVTDLGLRASSGVVDAIRAAAWTPPALRRLRTTFGEGIVDVDHVRRSLEASGHRPRSALALARTFAGANSDAALAEPSRRAPARTAVGATAQGLPARRLIFSYAFENGARVAIAVEGDVPDHDVVRAVTAWLDFAKADLSARQRSLSSAR